MAEILGIGTEIVECLRIAQMMERHADGFINRVFTDHEIEYCNQRKAMTQHYAGHWAAKEAILKAMSARWQRGIGFRDVEVRTDNGKTIVALRGGARDLCESLGITRILVSIAHCRTHATAYAIAMGKPRDEDGAFE